MSFTTPIDVTSMEMTHPIAESTLSLGGIPTRR